MRAVRSVAGRRLVAALAITLVAAGVSLAYAQQIWVGGGFGRGGRMAPHWAKPGDFDGSFLYCRGYYEQVRYEDGGMGWWTDYPNADHNFSVRLAELTRVYVKDWNTDPKFVVVSLEDPLLYRCPTALHGRRRHGGIQRARGENSARVFPEGRLPLGRRFLGLARLDPVVAPDGSRAAAERVSDRRHPAHASHHAHALRREGLSADSLDQLLGREPTTRRRSAAATAPRCTSAAFRSGGPPHGAS